MEAVPAGVSVHVLPTGDEPPAYADRSVLRYRDPARVATRIRCTASGNDRTPRSRV